MGTPAAAAVVSAIVRAAAPPLRACQPGAPPSARRPTHSAASRPAIAPMPTCSREEGEPSLKPSITCPCAQRQPGPPRAARRSIQAQLPQPAAGRLCGLRRQP